MADASIQVRTAPRDKRFPTQNQTKHCWARYLEFHACAKVKGEEDPECEKFKRWYGSLCPTEWVRRFLISELITSSKHINCNLLTDYSFLVFLM